ncbi:MAG: hypothetical protein J5476_16090 [Lachnospiraceae bacterium]|nr:hypothetical protein [Lachnospiraceae bacterium]
MFTNRRHPYMGIMSAILGLIALISLLYGIGSSYLLGGDVPMGFGAAALLATLYSLTGWFMGVIAVRLPDCFKVTSITGIILNSAALILSGFLLWIPT